jgi:hypothetical protein
VVQLLQVATCFWCIRRLRWLPAAAHISSNQAQQLIQAAEMRGDHESVEQLRMLPKTRQLAELAC